ncbi:Serine protease Hip1-like protein [Cladobotryum mycophilum]|uniref:Serine protease Hip1-like protein n=1 Tax=Cladobotryum mycophilum TaxID=491253 RepID=A0ABR0ST61_9HYPO
MRRYHQILLASAATLQVASATATFNWDTITPSRDLVYHDCFDGFKCARLAVPLDWTNESDNRTTAIAITKLPAVVSDDDPAFGGTMMTNPGGPGASGVEFVKAFGKSMQGVVDRSGKHFEMFSWDPRGIGQTTPRSDCFNADVAARNALTFELRGNGALDLGLNTLEYGLGMNDALAEQCEESDDGHQVMAFVNTRSVVRDMVEMLDKIDELRKGKSHKRSDDKDVPRLQYWGFSYGTILGNYFASLYPGRVGRIILDGVDNADDYAKGTGWLTNLVDTDKIFDAFWDGCFKAGSSVCALASKNETAEDAKSHFWSWVESLDKRPIRTKSPNGSVMVLKGSDIRVAVAHTLYQPSPGFKQLAGILASAMNGNATLLTQGLLGEGELPGLHNDQHPPEAVSAVACSDGDDVTGKDASFWDNPTGPSRDPSPPPADPKIVADRPAAPLLFLNSRLDPVTPLSAARAMAKGHPGSAVVVQESMGHTALINGPSKCTWDIVSEYLSSGNVPKTETVCETSCGPWDDNCDPFQLPGEKSLATRGLLSRARSFSGRRVPFGLL